MMVAPRKTVVCPMHARSESRLLREAKSQTLVPLKISLMSQKAYAFSSCMNRAQMLSRFPRESRLTLQYQSSKGRKFRKGKGRLNFFDTFLFSLNVELISQTKPKLTKTAENP